MRIAKKHFLLTGTIIFIVVTTVLASLYFAMPVYYEQVKQREANSEFRQIAQQVQGKPSNGIGKLLSDYNRKNTRVWFSLFDSKGKVIYPNLDLTTGKGELQLTILPSDMSLNEQSKSIRKKIKTAEGTTLTLQGEYSLQPISDASYVLLNLYPYILFFSLALGGVAAFLYSRFATKRITDISESTRKMATLSPDVACPVKGRDEISTLAQDINSLYNNLLTSIEALRLENEKVAESEREKAEFLRMTSHELKTPITSMMGIVDGMIYGVGDFKDKDKYLQKCREILEEQSKLVQSILAISKIEMRIEAEEEDFSLKQLLEENLSTYKMLADMKGYKFTVSLEELQIHGNKTYLLKAIKNLLDNAFHYGLSGGEILLTIQNGQLMIENDAEHVLDGQQIQQIFQPFYRPDYSRNRKDGGTGLGLFIVQQILENHRLRYRFEVVDDKRMRFTIFFSDKES
ncbi:sensor histidine kinase [Streptococcus anginosus]|uniref:sensor histidine kinase n=1 Tax=Streptococcus anginosus TaxID=1328 RepID=UPI00066C0E36|nr:HAMP domain-containing sensor histidine kinase [Streptococcus anginosus]MCW0997300.1 HAMP domain-containing histidine kinase [Streptococcus anginosus]